VTDGRRLAPAEPTGSGPDDGGTAVIRTLEEELARAERYIDQKERVLAANAMELRHLADELQRARDRLQSKTEELEGANARLGELDRLKSSFLASVSHELRTPLTAILISARLLGRSLARPTVGAGAERADEAVPTEAHVEIIIEEADRLGRLIHDILDLTRIEAGGVEWRFEPLRPAEFVRAAVGAIAPLLRDWGLVPELDLPDDLPPVRADRDRMIQVLTNLVGNAGKFTSAGGRIRVAARTAMLAPREGPGVDVARPFVLFSVTDTGCGIAACELPRIFTTFARVAEPPPGRPSGTGLGLALAKEVVEAHGGWIWVTSDWGTGSTFSFTVPVAAGTAADARPGAGRSPRA
jgi:signal transduction histidine kinase